MPKLHGVELADADRQTLEALLDQGGLSARQARRIHTLLLADDGETDETIAEQLDTHRNTVERTRKRFAQEGLQAVLVERPRSGGPPKLDGKQQALVVALACSDGPDGQTRWTLRQLATRLVALEVVETISHETIRRLLKKMRSSRGKSSRGACRT